jgi:hypothetical protein
MHVYGYVLCDGMIDGELAHSCRHGPPPHEIKVCITKKHNEQVWPHILQIVGPKPEDRERQVLREFMKAFRAADMERFYDALSTLDTDCPLYWTDALRRVARSASPPDQFRHFLLDVWRHHGDHIRQEVDDDLLLARALRVMLPPYTGPAITLYRGEGFRNRKRRTYGLAWSRQVEIAREFARTGLWRTTNGGSVLLEVTAPSEAIICEVPETDDSYAEKEVIVDRRHLRAVKVLERFSPLTCDEFRLFQENLPRER